MSKNSIPGLPGVSSPSPWGGRPRAPGSRLSSSASPLLNTASNLCILKRGSFFLTMFRLFDTLRPINVSSEHFVQSMYPKPESFIWQCFASSEHCVQSMYPEQKRFLLTMFRFIGTLRPINVSWTRKFFLQCFPSSEHCIQSMYPKQESFFFMFRLSGTLRPLNVSWTKKFFFDNVRLFEILRTLNISWTRKFLDNFRLLGILRPINVS